MKVQWQLIDVDRGEVIVFMGPVFDLDLEKMTDRFNETYVTGTSTREPPVGILNYKEGKKE
jgi:hypothetical protein